MNIKRSDVRHETFAYWTASNTDTGHRVGTLVDVTKSGLKLHSEQPIPVGDIFNLTIHVDRKIAGHGSLTLKAQVLWCHNVPGSQLFGAGLTIVASSREFVEAEQKLVEYFSRPD